MIGAASPPLPRFFWLYPGMKLYYSLWKDCKRATIYLPPLLVAEANVPRSDWGTPADAARHGD